MKKIADFQKASLEQFNTDLDNVIHYSDKKLFQIPLPARATKGSAGHDIASSIDFSLYCGESICIPTGLRVTIKKGRWMAVLPRSGHVFHYRIQFDNTVGVIDSDYYSPDNEGHIFIKLTNAGLEGKTVSVQAGEQVIFLTAALENK